MHVFFVLWPQCDTWQALKIALKLLKTLWALASLPERIKKICNIEKCFLRFYLVQEQFIQNVISTLSQNNVIIFQVACRVLNWKIKVILNRQWLWIKQDWTRKYIFQHAFKSQNLEIKKLKIALWWYDIFQELHSAS